MEILTRSWQSASNLSASVFCSLYCLISPAILLLLAKLKVAFSVARSCAFFAWSYPPASSNEPFIFSMRRDSSRGDWEATASTLLGTRNFFALIRMLWKMSAALYAAWVTALPFSLYSESPVVETLCYDQKDVSERSISTGDPRSLKHPFLLLFSSRNTALTQPFFRSTPSVSLLIALLIFIFSFCCWIVDATSGQSPSTVYRTPSLSSANFEVVHSSLQEQTILHPLG